MTTKPPAGIQRQPQRSLSGTGIIQRPTPHRTLSQQYPSSASVRKPDNIVDLTQESAETSRYGSSRIGGSRLKLELSKDSKDAPSLVESPRTAEAVPKSEPGRGRPKLHFDGYRPQLQGADDTSVLSSIRKVENVTGQNSIPLPRRPVQSAPPFARGQRVAPANGAKKEVRPKPYVLGIPLAAPHYLPNGESPQHILLDLTD
jgi:mediator of RNA polymerase II transcription subunit 12